ncbi:MAG: PD-(D/E)XK nuclease family protein [Pseudomonadales bacterium]|nr:PD-(D/E)XK nuclease family protein [Candidatus Woesebacteria bacterium]MCB9801275.1 PD-(D/E)XK nuclease family protein [Pseudomonadales bacterium]
MPDKYAAVWVSHTSMSDFLKCPRSYFLKNVYKDPKTGHKIQLMTPPLALGSAVHEVVESLSTIPTKDRFKESLLAKYEQVWKKVAGKKGGFHSKDEEEQYKEQGRDMLRRIIKNPGPLQRLSVKIRQDLPHYWLSEEDEIILCGKIDWLEYLPEEDAVHIIDFKTSKSEEDDSSLQLPIYHLLVHNTQKRKVAGASYWYLRLHDDLSPKDLPDLEAAHQEVFAIAKKIRTVRKLEKYDCPNGSDGCFACRPMEKILRREAEYVGENEYRQDVYILPEKNDEISMESDIL